MAHHLRQRRLKVRLWSPECAHMCKLHSDMLRHAATNKNSKLKHVRLLVFRCLCMPASLYVCTLLCWLCVCADTHRPTRVRCEETWKSMCERRWKGKVNKTLTVGKRAEARANRAFDPSTGEPPKMSTGPSSGSNTWPTSHGLAPSNSLAHKHNTLDESTNLRPPLNKTPAVDKRTETRHRACYTSEIGIAAIRTWKKSTLHDCVILIDNNNEVVSCLCFLGLTDLQVG